MSQQRGAITGSVVVLYANAPRATQLAQFYFNAFYAALIHRSTAYIRQTIAGLVFPINTFHLRIGGITVLVTDRIVRINDANVATFDIPVELSIEANDIDTSMENALGAGAEILSEVDEREMLIQGLNVVVYAGEVRDPAGYTWTIWSRSAPRSPPRIVPLGYLRGR